MQHTATHCNALQHTVTHSNTLQHTARHCKTLQHTATHCNTLQHTATQHNTLQHPTTVLYGRSLPTDFFTKKPDDLQQLSLLIVIFFHILYCSVLQCVAVWCSVSQCFFCVVVCGCVLQCVAVGCSSLPTDIFTKKPDNLQQLSLCIVRLFHVLYHSVLQCVAVRCSAMQCVAMCCS